eukprot:m.232472 g.232472  ORF g.232472 m.232472 type:complete len:356 (+) comp19276_c0_seq3:1413-2480(+)
MDGKCGTDSTGAAIPSVLRSLVDRADLHAAAARVVGAGPTAGHAHVVPTSLTVRVLLPGMEIPVATDAPEYHRVPVRHTPEWLRRVARHSCVLEDRRYRTAKALMWLAPPTRTSPPPGTVEDRRPTSPPRAFCYPNGSRYPKVSLPGVGDAAIAVLDGQTLWHGVAAAAGAAGRDSPRPRKFPRGARLHPPRGTATTWAVDHNGTVLYTVPAADVAVLLVWEAVVLQGSPDVVRGWEARHDQRAIPVNDTVDALVAQLRDTQRLGYKEHLVHSGVPPRVRWNLADLLVSEFLAFPHATRWLAWLQGNRCRHLSVLPSTLGPWVAPVIGCQTPCTGERSTAAAAGTTSTDAMRSDL